MGEVAEIAGDAKETIRARINRGLAPQQKSPGWARLDVPSTVQIAVHAEMLRRTANHEIALKTADFVGDSIANVCNYPPHLVRRKGQLGGSYLLFRSISHGIWTERWCGSQDDALHMVGSHIADSQYLEAAGFYFLNISTLADWALDRVFDLQGIEGNQAEAPK
jgi:hypothetical protein